MERNKHMGRRIAFGVILVLAAAALVAAPFILEKRSRSGETEATVLSGTVSRGSITKTLSGTGTLTEQEAKTVTVPEGVEITAYLAANGDTVTEGQPVAKVDKTSVMRAISDVNKAMDSLSKKITAAADKKADQFVTAKSVGRVKAVYADPGDSVRDVVTEYGALAVISLDGKMAVDVATRSLAVGQSVNVTLSEGKVVAGTVHSLSDAGAVVTIDDQFGAIGETVTVSDADGGLLGEGTLYVHSPWKAMAYTGTVSAVYMTVGKKTWAGANLFRLTGTENTAEYELLIEQRREYEDILQELFLLYQDGVVKAPCDGCVSGADESLLKQTAAENGGYTLMLLSSAHTPPDDAETDGYHNRVGVITEVNDDGTVSASIQLFDTEIPDYADLNVNTDISNMTGEIKDFRPATIYVRSGDAWETMSGVKRGDLFVFTFDTDLAWMIYVGHTDLPEPTPEPTPRPTPSPTPGPSGSPQPSGSPMPSGSPRPSQQPRIDPRGGTTDQQQTEETLPSTEGTVILSVTPQDTMTVAITVDELDILSVRMGQEVSVTVDALPGQSFPGDITSIDTSAANEGGNSKYTVEITLDRTGKMLGGMNASARITLLTRDDILTVPTQALSEGETETVVYMGYDETTETLTGPVKVETGLSDGLTTQIVSGLSEGDVIWYTYYDTLPDALPAVVPPGTS